MALPGGIQRDALHLRVTEGQQVEATGKHKLGLSGGKENPTGVSKLKCI